jgi:predicted transcriptional regulator
MTAKLRQITVRLSDETIDALDVAAESSGRIRSQIVCEALDKYLVVTLAALARKRAEAAERINPLIS